MRISDCGSGLCSSDLFGRIGRLFLRAAYESGRDDIDCVGINDLGPVKANVHLVKYDTVHGTLKADIVTGEDWMDLGRGKLKVTAERDQAKLPWKELGVDVAQIGRASCRERVGQSV